jgi:transcriptional regulator with XRE-family HTH domain
VDTKHEIRDFLVSRRGRIGPEQAGLTAFSRQRRVPGLRREEVAALAGISVEYYTRIERGATSGVSDDVLAAIGQALQLDEAERSHLHNLFRAAASVRAARRAPAQQRVRPTVQRLLDSMVGVPAYVRNGRLDVLAANTLGAALYSQVLDDPTGPPNVARFVFLDVRSTEFFLDWESVANDAVAILRAEAGRDPYDRKLTDLVGELSMRSEEFRGRWAAHDVKFHRTGTKRLHHPLVGDLVLAFEALDLPGDSGQRILAYSAEPASPSHDALELLASWSATDLGSAR